MRIRTGILIGLMAGAGLLWGLTVNGSLAVLGLLTAAQVDMSGASSSKPVRHASTAPAACSLGEQYFNTSAKASWVCTDANVWTQLGAGSAVAAGPDPAKLTMEEEFLSGTGSTNTAGTTGIGWNVLASGTVSWLNVGSNSASQHPGVIALNTSTTANSGVHLAWANNYGGAMNPNTAIYWNDLFTNDWAYRVVARVNTIGGTRLRFGLSEYPGALVPGSFLGVRYDTDAVYSDNAKNTSGSWVLQVCGFAIGACSADAGGLTANVVSPGAPASATWYDIRVVKTGLVLTASVNGGTPVAVTLPTLAATTIAVAPGVLFGTPSAATSRSLWVDYMSFQMSGMVRY
jgi:hypothetical protein